MARFTLPRDLYHGKGALEALKTFEGKRAIVCVGGGSMKRFGFLDRAVDYLKEAGMEVQLFEGIESDPSVETVMRGAKAMEEFQPDWIVAMGGGSPIDAAKAMWIKYEYPDITFEEMCKVFGMPKLRRKAHFCAISSTSGTATEVTAFAVITDYEKGIKYPLADFEITPDVAIVDPDQEMKDRMPKVTQGQTFYAVAAEKTEHFTSPPKPYSEDTLLAAMETAGNKEFDEDTEKKGLGTPATRAGIIEKLIYSQYATRKGKQILPTDDGKVLVEILPDFLKSASMTAEWENQLLLMEHGEIAPEQFMTGIKNMLTMMLNGCDAISDQRKHWNLSGMWKPGI